MILKRILFILLLTFQGVCLCPCWRIWCSYYWRYGTWSSAASYCRWIPNICALVHGWETTQKSVPRASNQLCAGYVPVGATCAGDWIAICVFIFGSLAVIWLLVNNIDPRHKVNILRSKGKKCFPLLVRVLYPVKHALLAGVGDICVCLKYILSQITALGFALSPHNKKAQSWDSALGPFRVEFACFPQACVGPHQEHQHPPAVGWHAVSFMSASKLSVDMTSMCLQHSSSQ